MAQPVNISENSQRIVKNSLMLYVRMFVLLIISLFSARIVLNALGVEANGIYSSVASFVSLMSIVSNALSSAISRFITVEIGRGDNDSIRKVFSTANGIMALVSLAVFVIAEPLGSWYISNVMNLPAGKVGAAMWVFQFSLFTFILGLLSIPYNATIIARERMSAFAVIGIVEGVCKLTVALLIASAPFDRLVFYSMLLCIVALLVRTMYVLYCRYFCQESRSGFKVYREYFKPMFAFSGWNIFSSGALIVNTHGITLLVNFFFGVTFNTMRDIASKVEGMVKQFVMNVLVSFSPQITKSYIRGDKNYCFTLACKGSKFVFLVIFTLAVPFWFESGMLLHLWFGEIVPEETFLFTKLSLLCLLADLIVAPVSNIISATGKVGKYYLITSLVTLLTLPITWLMYRNGSSVISCYIVFFCVYTVCDIVRLLLAKAQVGFPIRLFVRDVLVRILPVILITLPVTYVVWRYLPEGWIRLVSVLFVGTGLIIISCFFFALTDGEKSFIRLKISQFIRKKGNL